MASQWRFFPSFFSLMFHIRSPNHDRIWTFWGWAIVERWKQQKMHLSVFPTITNCWQNSCFCEQITRQGKWLHRPAKGSPRVEPLICWLDSAVSNVNNFPWHRCRGQVASFGLSAAWKELQQNPRVSEQRSVNVNNAVLGIERIPAMDTLFDNNSREAKK